MVKKLLLSKLLLINKIQVELKNKNWVLSLMMLTTTVKSLFILKITYFNYKANILFYGLWVLSLLIYYKNIINNINVDVLDIHLKIKNKILNLKVFQYLLYC